MSSKHPPFNAATPQDPFYVALASGNFSVFWKKHSEHKAEGDNFFPEDFKDLFQGMTQLDPEKRIVMKDIKEHPWYIKECKLEQKDVASIFTNRFKQLNEELLERSATQESSLQRNEAYNPSESSYSHQSHRKDAPEQKFDVVDFSIYKDAMQQYKKVFKLQTEFFSHENPKILF